MITQNAAERLGAGQAAEIVAEIRALPVERWTPAVRLVLADALRMTGDVAGAQRAFQPLVDTAERTGRWTAALAWRASMLCYLRSDYEAALTMLSRAQPAGDPTADDVHLYACRAAVHGQLGDVASARISARHALEAAARVGDDRALAAARVAASVTASGVRRHEHLAAGLAAAERAGDLVQQTRILVNQSDLLLREARYAEALTAAARAVRSAGGSPPGIRVVALHNAGEALTWLGRYAEAAEHFERSTRLSRELDLNRAAAGVYGLAEVHRLLGRREQALAGFEEAAELARSGGDRQVLVPALAGLARLAGDTAAGEEAVRLAPPSLASCALAGRGWAAVAQGAPAAAQKDAAEAVAAARAARQPEALAGALELVAASAVDSAVARAALVEAADIWHRAGAEPAADRMRVLLGRLPGADAEARMRGRTAAGRLVAWGLPDEVPATVSIRVLGPFEVALGARAVPLTAWRSRQARTLLKILVGRRGRPVTRGELSELLWPDDDPQRTAHRLSVLLLAVRTVLDPARRAPADHYLRADAAGLSLALEQVSVDAEDLLSDVAYAAAQSAAGHVEAARAALVHADAAYRGEAFEDEPYEDWADGLREQVRAAWLTAVRELARICRRAGDPDQAVMHLVRLLSADPYDEAAHRTLVEALTEAGRHGEARRAFERWTRAMRAIDAPAPAPGPLSTGSPGR
ncbi:BTAD domain-containing putative transcriptional regulator [Actinoplanes sp. NPDC049548]|uniref:BTAD domain-containing putative transcriptional regulator n=1 Tax=Actinoplanes sp. NPDC049548 TaxID=3155152 RepID=UPI00342D7782